MKLYFLRHGPALSRSEWAGPDADRPLTPRGERLTRDVAMAMRNLGVTLDAIITSPFERALRTALIVHDTLDGVPRLSEHPGLAPAAFSVESLVEILKAQTGSAVMIVGHEPSMGEVLGDVVGGGRYDFKKAGLALIDIPEPPLVVGTLRWFVPPRLLSETVETGAREE